MYSISVSSDTPSYSIGISCIEPSLFTTANIYPNIAAFLLRQLTPNLSLLLCASYDFLSREIFTPIVPICLVSYFFLAYSMIFFYVSHDTMLMWMCMSNRCLCVCGRAVKCTTHRQPVRAGCRDTC